MWTRTIATAAALLSLASSASADVRISMIAGRVSISAKNATVPQILAEWARVGNTRIVNAAQVTGAPLTLELTDLPELQALEILLRGTGGYVIAPRIADSENPTASTFDRVLIVPASTNAVRPAAAPPTPQPRVNVPINRDDEANDAPGVPAPRFAPITNGDRAPAPEQGAPAPTPGPILNAPPGVARPGMIMPAPTTTPGSDQR